MSSELLILNNALQQHWVVADFVVLALFITVYWRRAVPVMFPIFHICQVYVVVWLWMLTMNCPDTVKTLMQCSQTWFQAVSWLPACLLEWVTFSIISCGMSSFFIFFSPLSSFSLILYPVSVSLFLSFYLFCSWPPPPSESRDYSGGPLCSAAESHWTMAAFHLCVLVLGHRIITDSLWRDVSADNRVWVILS